MSTSRGQHIFVRLRNGVTVGVTQVADPALRVGERVRIVRRSEEARVERA